MDGLGGIRGLFIDLRAGPGQALRDPLTSASEEPCSPDLSFPEQRHRNPHRHTAVPVEKPHSIHFAQDPPDPKDQVRNSSIHPAPIHCIASNLNCGSERTDQGRNVAYIKVRLQAIDNALGTPISGSLIAALPGRVADMPDADPRWRSGGPG